MDWSTYQKIRFPLSKVEAGSVEYDSLKQAAESGTPSAQHDMGKWQETVAHNYEEALNWYEKAAISGHEGSQESYNDLANQLGKPGINWC